MDCRVAQEKILPFIKQELTSEQTESFIEHVDNCAECNEELQISYSLYQGLRMLDQDDVDSFNIQQAFDEFMEEQHEKIRKRHALRRVMFWIMILVITGVVLFFVMQILRWLNHDLFDLFWRF